MTKIIIILLICLGILLYVGYIMGEDDDDTEGGFY
jgi:hypothetical protein